MHRFWRVTLPIVGLLLFSLVSWRDFRVNREIHQHLPNKYFMWSAIRLDTDPTNQRNWDVGSCKDGDENCVRWDLMPTVPRNPTLLMPVLLLIWFYFVGRVLDGWIKRRSKRSISTLGCA